MPTKARLCNLSFSRVLCYNAIMKDAIMRDSTSWLIANGRVVGPRGILDDATLLVEQGRITEISAQPAVQKLHTRRLDARGNLIVPGLIDVHVHGGRGYDVMDGTVEAVDGLAVHLAAHGVTGFLATTVTASQADTLAAAAVVRKARRRRSPGARLLGMHIEGPYLNPLRPGAQDIAHIRLPSIDEMKQVIAASGDCVRLVTLAPELAGASDLVHYLRQCGIIASMGHSDATYEQAMAALDAGFTHVTHIFNAMRPFHHRDPGIIGAALLDPRVMIEVIADGLHVHPAAARLVLQARGTSGVELITDAICAAGLPYGCYRMGGQDVCTSDKGARTAGGVLAGSLITMETALRNIVAWTGLPLCQATAMTSLNQARELGLDGHTGSLEVGKDADLVVCTPTFDVLATMVGGRMVFRSGSTAVI
jgi:N-acetylglucosamine-6-phosphate deacetylase